MKAVYHVEGRSVVYLQLGNCIIWNVYCLVLCVSHKATNRLFECDSKSERWLDLIIIKKLKICEWQTMRKILKAACLIE
jgi:hypothetical protein